MRERRKPVLYILLTVLSLLMLLPLVWMLLSSLKSESELFAVPLKFLPSRWHFENYTELMKSAPWRRYFLNTLLITIFSVGGQLVVCAMAAFAFAKMRFRSKKVLFLAYLATMMVPYQVIMIPQFEVICRLGWIDRHVSLIVPAWYSAIGILMLRQYFASIPDSLVDAAKIDGCSYPRLFYEVILKNSGPGLAALALTVIVGTWNEFLRPLIYLNSDSKWTLTMGLQKFQGQYLTQWNQVMAGALLSALPVILLFIAAQRYFVEGVVTSGMKE